MLCINTFWRVMYFPDLAKKKIQNGRTSTLTYLPMHQSCFKTVSNVLYDLISSEL